MFWKRKKASPVTVPLFSNSVILEKNTKDIRDYLEKLGYVQWNYVSDDLGIVTTMFNFKTVSLSMPNELTPIYSGLEDFIDIEWLEDNGYINCHDNEELFKAIVALQEHSDIHQWFTNEDNSEWIISKTVKWNGTIDFHKATLEELIKKFGNNEKIY